MKRFLFILGALIWAQTLTLMADSAADTVWTKTLNGFLDRYVEFAPDNNNILVRGENNDRYIVLVFTENRDTLAYISNSDGLQFSQTGGGGVMDAHFSADGQYLILLWMYGSHSDRFRIELYSTATWEKLKGFDLPDIVAFSIHGEVVMSPDNQIIVGMAGEKVSFYDVASGELIKSFPMPSGKDPKTGGWVSVYNAVYSPDGSYIYFTGDDGKLRWLNTETYKIDYIYDSGYGNLAMSRDGSMLAFKTGTKGKAVKIMNTQTKEILHAFDGHASWVDAISFSGDNRYVSYTARTTGKRIFVYDIVTGENVYNYTIDLPSYYGNSISYDNQYLAAFAGNWLALYHFMPNLAGTGNAAGEPEAIYPNPTSGVATIKFTSAAPNFATIAIYDTQGNMLKSVFEGHLSGGEQTITFDTSDLPAGTYFVKVNSNGSDITFKLMVQG